MMDAMKYFGSPVHFSIEKNQLLEIYPNPEKKQFLFTATTNININKTREIYNSSSSVNVLFVCLAPKER